MAEYTGGCQCGQVRYSILAEPIMLYACHCRDCQRQSGSAFGMSLIVADSAFRLDSGNLKTFETRADSGRSKTCAFCPDCGARIYNAVTSSRKSIKAGTLDDVSKLQPRAHIWTSRKQPWTVLPADLRCYSEEP
jgi:hypothetical protein